MVLTHFAGIHHVHLEPHDFGGGMAGLHVLLAICSTDDYEMGDPAT